MGLEKFKSNRIVKALSLTISSLIGLPASAMAIQHDGPYYDYEKKNKEKIAEDKAKVDAKLAALKEKFGKSPNIIYILTDDIGWGELGCYMGGKLRGTPSPTLDQMADEGMKFLSNYTEPSSTPTRLALLTGRYPTRTGVNGVLWPGATDGLAAEEITVAEVLKEAGYHTGMWGKWHVGELPEAAPENQGFDYAYYGLYNGAPFAWVEQQGVYKADTIVSTGWFYDYPGNEKYKEEYGIELQGIFEGRAGEGREEVAKLSMEEMTKFESDSTDQMIEFIKEKSATDKPFFIYWASYAQQIGDDPQYRDDKFVDDRNTQASQMMQHNMNVKRILDALKELGIAENTLVYWISDNGPMYAFWPTSGYTWLRGGKGDVYEGGVRTPAIAWWPGMIEPGQDPIDMIHVTDLFTTAARLAGVMEAIPNDRVTDGIDQTALLILGEGHSHRDFIIHYSGPKPGAVRMGDYKAIIKPAHGGIPGLEIYNMKRDPGEKFGSTYNYLWLIQPFQNMAGKHLGMVKKFPHRILKGKQEAEYTHEPTSRH